MNTWVRNLINNRMVNFNDVRKMIQDANYQGVIDPLEVEQDLRNPIIKCFYEDVDSKSLERLVKAIGQINIDYLSLQ